ncbi:unnamed protein product [Symbiodinium natans]|uniref:Methyltransferase FkbM domain-containing protein n=1 Tax=Symbiodinium natans TaxID=878477 RepID=A0A812KF55_9DINO|nr:unnamed protein product [Symbiodinium natans]
MALVRKPNGVIIATGGGGHSALCPKLAEDVRRVIDGLHATAHIGKLCKRCDVACGGMLRYTPQMRESLCREAKVSPTAVTLGIGDGGNEVGMGAVVAIPGVPQLSPGDEFAALSANGCYRTCDHLLLGTVSNWAGSAFEAAASVLYPLPAKKDYMVNLNGGRLRPGDLEELLLRDIMASPTFAVDGKYNDRLQSVDGMSFDPYHRDFHLYLWELVSQTQEVRGSLQPLHETEDGIFAQVQKKVAAMPFHKNWAHLKKPPERLWIEVGMNNWDLSIHYGDFEAWRGMVFPFAVGCEGMAEFRVTEEDACSTLLDLAQSTLPEDYQHPLLPNFKADCATAKETRKVPCISLEHVLRHWLEGREVWFLKVDAEGSDLKVVQSAGDMLRKIRHVQVEVQAACASSAPQFVNAPNCTAMVRFMHPRPGIEVSETPM